MISTYVSDSGKLTKVDLVNFGKFVAGQTEVHKVLVFEAKEGVSDVALTLEKAGEGISVLFNGKDMVRGEPVAISTRRSDSTLLQGERSNEVELVIKSTDKVSGGVQPVQFKMTWLYPA